MGGTELVTTFRAIEETLNGGILGVSAIYLPTGERIDYQAEAIFPTASVIKAPIIATLMALRSEGHFSETELETRSVTIEERDIVGGSGILSQLTPGLALSLYDLATLAISLSDNTASNLCLRQVGGPEAVNHRMRNDWGMSDTRVHRPIKFHLTENDPPHTATGSPADMCRFMEQIARRTLVDPDVSEAVERYLAAVNDTEMLPRYLSVNYYAKDLGKPGPEFTVAHKAGAISGVRNEAGIVRRGEEALAICIYTRGCPDTNWTAANRGSEVVAQTAQHLCRYFFNDD